MDEALGTPCTQSEPFSRILCPAKPIAKSFRPPQRTTSSQKRTSPIRTAAESHLLALKPIAHVEQPLDMRGARER